MASEVENTAESGPVAACTISRDIQEFELLIEDMENILGENWGDLGFDEAILFFSQPEGAELEFVAVAVDSEDERHVDQISLIIEAAQERGIKVIVVAEDVKPGFLHRLIRSGADEFVPYPLPEGELKAAIEKVQSAQEEEPAEAAGAKTRSALSKSGGHEGVVIAAQGLAGGVGTTTFLVNLAWELAQQGDEKEHPRVCILDLDLQTGSVSTYLDLPRREAVFEMLQDVDHMDDEIFDQALVSFEDRLHVLTAPPEMLPLDMLAPDEVQKLIDMARHHFDYVLIDMPRTLVQWSETVLVASHVYFALIELDMRSAQNTLRLKRALQGEELPFDKLRFALNRAPGFTDLAGRSRVKRMAESLGIAINLQFPDGGRQVLQACDHGQPLAVQAPKNPFRKEIAKLAATLHAVGQTEAEAA